MGAGRGGGMWAERDGSAIGVMTMSFLSGKGPGDACRTVLASARTSCRIAVSVLTRPLCPNARARLDFRGAAPAAAAPRPMAPYPSPTLQPPSFTLCTLLPSRARNDTRHHGPRPLLSRLRRPQAVLPSRRRPLAPLPPAARLLLDRPRPRHVVLPKDQRLQQEGDCLHRRLRQLVRPKWN